MSSVARRKRSSRDLRCVLFPDDVRDVARVAEGRQAASSSSLKSWQRRGDGFTASLALKEVKRTRRTNRAARRRSPALVKSDDEAVNIAWSSTESDESGCEAQAGSSPSAGRAEHSGTLLQAGRSTPGGLRLLSTGTEELPAIESDSDDGEEFDISDSSIPSTPTQKHASKAEMLPEVQISDCPSDEDCLTTGTATASGGLDPCPSPSAEASRPSLSDWVRAAQAMLQTPQRQADVRLRTPEDSHGKRRKFERGGLAERLSRLQARQRSAVSFWRHQASSGAAPTAEKPGVLVVRLLSVQEDCGMKAALCARLVDGHQDPGDDRCLVLFNRDTVTQLGPVPGDLIHIYPPWQSLLVEGERHPVILNTLFSQKVVNPAGPEPPSLVGRSRPCPLWKCFGLPEAGQAQNAAEQVHVRKQVCRDPGGMCDSLLEALESSGSTGTLGRLVQVVVQRVYTVPFPQSSALKHRGLWTSPGTEVATSQSSSSRVCVLVQDSWGVFGEVRLQQSGSEPHPQRFQAWEGRSCVLRDITVVQRVTRDRCVHLFSLIDSLWPPALPVTVECGAATCEESQVKVQPPSFCYRLSGREGSLLLSQGHPPSPLYQPAVLQSLAEILQAERRGVCCSFIAAVVFVQLQDSDAGDRESWLFVTDASLQGASGGRGSCSRCVAVCLRPSCSLQDSVRQAIGSSSPPSSSSACWLRFKDAVLQQGGVVCLEQTVVSPEPAGPSGPLPRPLVLDPLSPDTPPNTLCSLSGVVLGVEEDSAYSWPVCSVCESERLEIAPDKTSAFVCTACGVVVEKPTVKLHLEVFLSCPTLGPQATVKVKLQQDTIRGLLSIPAGGGGGGGEGRCSVERVLGTEVGPTGAYVRVVAQTPALCVAVEEIRL